MVDYARSPTPPEICQPDHHLEVLHRQGGFSSAWDWCFVEGWVEEGVLNFERSQPH